MQCQTLLRIPDLLKLVDSTIRAHGRYVIICETRFSYATPLFCWFYASCSAGPISLLADRGASPASLDRL